MIFSFRIFNDQLIATLLLLFHCNSFNASESFSDPKDSPIIPSRIDPSIDINLPSTLQDDKEKITCETMIPESSLYTRRKFSFISKKIGNKGKKILFHPIPWDIDDTGRMKILLNGNENSESTIDSTPKVSSIDSIPIPLSSSPSIPPIVPSPSSKSSDSSNQFDESFPPLGISPSIPRPIVSSPPKESESEKESTKESLSNQKFNSNGNGKRGKISHLQPSQSVPAFFSHPKKFKGFKWQKKIPPPSISSSSFNENFPLERQGISYDSFHSNPHNYPISSSFHFNHSQGDSSNINESLINLDSPKIESLESRFEDLIFDPMETINFNEDEEAIQQQVSESSTNYAPIFYSDSNSFFTPVTVYQLVPSPTLSSYPPYGGYGRGMTTIPEMNPSPSPTDSPFPISQKEKLYQPCFDSSTFFSNASNSPLTIFDGQYLNSSHSSTCCTSSQPLQSSQSILCQCSSPSLSTGQGGMIEEFDDNFSLFNHHYGFTGELPDYQNSSPLIPFVIDNSMEDEMTGEGNRKLEMEGEISFDIEKGKFTKTNEKRKRGKKAKNKKEILSFPFDSNGFFDAFNNFNLCFKKEFDVHNRRRRLLGLSPAPLETDLKWRFQPLVIEWKGGRFPLNLDSIPLEIIPKLTGEELLKLARKSQSLLDVTFHEWILHVPVMHLEFLKRDLNAWELLTVKVFKEAGRIKSFRKSIINVIGAHWKEKDYRELFLKREMIMTIYIKKIVRLEEIHNFIHNEEIISSATSKKLFIPNFPFKESLDCNDDKMILLKKITVLQTKLFFRVFKFWESDDRDERMKLSWRSSIQEKMEKFIVRSMRLLKTFWEIDSFKSSFEPISLISLFQNSKIRSMIPDVLLNELEHVSINKYSRIQLILHQALEMGNSFIALKIISRFGYGTFNENILKEILSVARKWNKMEQLESDNYAFITELHDSIPNSKDKLTIKCKTELQKLLDRSIQKEISLKGEEEKKSKKEEKLREK